MMRRTLCSGLCLAAALAGMACGGSSADPGTTLPGDDPAPEERVFLPEGSRCSSDVPPEILSTGSADPNCRHRTESIEADLNQDGHLDMRRVYLLACPAMLGEEVRPVILCREADINYDGRKDVFRHFREGEAWYEEQDWNFDGIIDARITFAGGAPLTIAYDRNGDGETSDMLVMLQNGATRRVKVDVIGTDAYDIYETYERNTDGSQGSQLTSLGFDLGGDGSGVDRLFSNEVVEPTPAPETPAAPAGGEE